MASLRLASPCAVPWAEMQMRPGGRHCAACNRQVHDLRRATEIEAAAVAVLFGASGLCARLRVDGEGQGVFRPAKVAAPMPRSLALAVAVGAGTTAGCASAPPTEAERCLPARAQVVTVPPPPAAPRPATGVARSEAVTRDADADGVIDDEDLCPTQAGAGKADGCPDVRRIIVESSGDMVVLQQVRFASGRADIPKPSQPILDEVARLLAGNPDIKLVAIEGHADGHERQPDQLSAKRADAAVAYLVKKGVDPKRLLPEHAGSAKPIAPNDTPDNREKNRRIEFHVR